jgi:hypothetical protein
MKDPDFLFGFGNGAGFNVNVMNPFNQINPMDALGNNTGVITLESAKHHDPILINWENHSGFRNFAQKIGVGVLLMVGTMLLWIVLYISYAMFYVNLIPMDMIKVSGAGSSFVQDMLLG